MPKKTVYKRVFQLFRPFFGVDTKLKRTHLLLVLSLIVANIGQAVLSTLITLSLDALMGAFVMEGLTLAIFIPIIGQSMALFLASALLGYATYYCFNKLVISLGHALDDFLRNKWLSDNKAYHGYKFFLSEKDKKTLDVSEVVVSLPMRCTWLAIDLFHSFISSSLLFSVGIVSLFLLSVPVVITLGPLSLVIPGVMVLGSIIYGLGFSKIANTFSKRVKSIYKKENGLDAELKNEVQHLNQHSENIAFKEGTVYERSRFKSFFDARDKTRWIRISLESKVAFLRTLQDPLSILVVSLLSVPSIIAKRVSGSQILGILHHFQNIALFLNWREKYMESIQELDVKTKNIEKFVTKCEAWEAALKKNGFKHMPSTGEFKVENLTLKTSEGMTVIKGLSINFKLNTVTILSGPSGVGKSTLLRAIAGLLPFGEGNITLTKNPDDICILSQQGYIPRDASLLEVILYPHADKKLKDSEEKQKIKTKIIDLLKRFQFKSETIEKLETPDNWSEILSGGEKQRIAYISAIMRDPKLLLMDEPSSALDDTMQKIAETILHTELPDATVVLIDHHPLEILPGFNSQKKRVIQKIELNPKDRQFINTPSSSSDRRLSLTA